MMMLKNFKDRKLVQDSYRDNVINKYLITKNVPDTLLTLKDMVDLINRVTDLGKKDVKRGIWTTVKDLFKKTMSGIKRHICLSVLLFDDLSMILWSLFMSMGQNLDLYVIGFHLSVSLVLVTTLIMLHKPLSKRHNVKDTDSFWKRTKPLLPYELGVFLIIFLISL